MEKQYKNNNMKQWNCKFVASKDLKKICAKCNCNKSYHNEQGQKKHGGMSIPVDNDYDSVYNGIVNNFTKITRKQFFYPN